MKVTEADRIKVALFGWLILCIVIAPAFFLLREGPRAASRYIEETSPALPDEFDLKWVSKDNYQANLVISLAAKTWYCMGATGDANSFAGHPQTQLTKDQASKVQSLIDELPASSRQLSWSSDDYKKEYHVAFYDRGLVVQYHYPRSGPPQQLSDLLKLLNIEGFYQ